VGALPPTNENKEVIFLQNHIPYSNYFTGGGGGPKQTNKHANLKMEMNRCESSLDLSTECLVIFKKKLSSYFVSKY